MLDHIGDTYPRIVFSAAIRWLMEGAIDWAAFLALLTFMHPPHGCWSWRGWGGVMVAVGAVIGAAVASAMFGAAGAATVRNVAIEFAGSAVGAVAAASVNVMAGQLKAVEGR
jgi:hypothetical protein